MTSRDSVRIEATVFRRAALALCTLVLTTHTVFALNPELDISQYVHTSWRVRDGFWSSALNAMAQTPDGYLWIGTNTGLFRFDGVRSVPWQAPPNQTLPSTMINELVTGRDGTLWIGTDKGLASWKNGTLAHYPDLVGKYIGEIVEARDAVVWVTAAVVTPPAWMLCAIQGGRATCYGADGGPGASALGLYEDSRGTLWVGTYDGVWQFAPGPPRFYRLQPQPNGFQGFADSDDGGLLLSMVGGIRRMRDGRVELVHPYPRRLQEASVNQFLRDRDGGIWGGTSAQGLVHVHHGVTDTYAQADGLSGDGINQIFEDREGSIWVLTRDGLDRFRDAPAASFSMRQGLSNSTVNSVLASRDGSVWVGTSDGLSRLNGSRVTVYRERPVQVPEAVWPASREVREITGRGLPGGVVGALFQDRLERIWVSTRAGVGYIENDQLVGVAGLPGGLTRAIVEDSRGVWVANLEHGLFQASTDNPIIGRVPWSALGESGPATAVAADPSRAGLWLGFADGRVLNFVDGQIRASYGAAEGLAKGFVRSLRLDRDGTVWVATDSGLTRVRGGRAATLTSNAGLPCDATQWLIEDAQSMWVGMSCGLVQIARSDIDAWASAVDNGGDANRTLPTMVFDHTDGVRLYSSASYFSAPAMTAADGKLWFMSPDGLIMVDPRHLPFNSVPPPVRIEQIIADRKTYDAAPDGTRLRLSPLTRDVQIDYTALSLVAAEKMRFRYQLEGYDSDWQDAATRRQAFYTNLPPGNYRFRVTASNNSGVWNDTGATLDFAIAPAYYQTNWFPALLAGMVIAAAWGTHRVRLRIVEKHEREILALNERLMKAQEQERIRIAGELHDGVMQEMLAATMMLGTAKRRVAGDSDAKATIDKVQEKLIKVGTDIRQLSHDLHPPVLQEAGLPEAVRGYCEQFSVSSGIPVSCDADDSARDLSRGAALALFRVVQEALGNAAKHAHAKRITVRLTRSADEVSLTVSDDGAGFDPGQLGASGGLGLIMMRERAGQLNGRFEFESAPGRGTAIRVVIPFR